MTERVSGLLLDDSDAAAVRDALDVFAALLSERGQRPSAKLAALMAKFAKNGADASLSGRNAASNARNSPTQRDSDQDSLYAFLETAQVAELLGITPNGVRDRARRGSIPARRAGGRWIYPSQAVLRLANRR